MVRVAFVVVLLVTIVIVVCLVCFCLISIMNDGSISFLLAKIGIHNHHCWRYNRSPSIQGNWQERGN